MFPATLTSAVRDLRSTDLDRRARARDVIARAYWKPVHAYIRLRWQSDPDSAQDLTQSFFEVAVGRDMLAGYTPGCVRFRSYLRACLDRHVIDQHRRASSQARGGGQVHVDLDVAGKDAATTGHDPESLFEQQWLRYLMELAVSEVDRRLVDAGKPVHAALFKMFHVDDTQPSYEEAARAHDVSVSNVRNWLHAARREFRIVALELLAALTLDEDDFAAEAKIVFGIDVRAGH